MAIKKVTHGCDLCENEVTKGHGVLPQGWAYLAFSGVGKLTLCGPACVRRAADLMESDPQTLIQTAHDAAQIPEG
ncbi:MAG: hypothetical protein AB1679_14360 [Actinomycetota bacterium]